MLKAGMTSVTFRKKAPEEIIAITKAAGLSAIEWGSDVHVREGDIAEALRVRELTLAAGLEVSSYGSYYKLGAGQDIRPFLECAKALGANTMRIWAGSIPSCKVTKEQRAEFVKEAKNAARLAAEYGISISLECHSYSLTDCLESQLQLLSEVGEPNFRTYWQALLEVELDGQLDTLKEVYETGKLTNIHVYWHKGDNYELLRYGRDYWKTWFAAVADAPETRYALIEFGKGSDEAFLDDAKTLIELVEETNKK